MITFIDVRKVGRVPVVFEEVEIFAAEGSSESDAAWDTLMPGRFFPKTRGISTSSLLNSWSRIRIC